MNILYVVYAYDSCKDDSGSGQRTLFLKKALDEIGTVYVYSPVFFKDQERTDSNARIAVRCIESRKSVLYCLNHFIVKWFKVLRINPFGASKSIARAFPDVEFDVVVCRYTLMASYVKMWNIAPVCIDVDDSPIEMFKTTKQNAWGFFGGIAEWIVREWQAGVFARAKALWVSNPEHVSLLPQGKGAWLPNLPPPNANGVCSASSPRNSIITIASFAHTPNVEGVAKFLAEVWPEFHKRHPEIRYRLIGKGAPGHFAEVEGVDVVGYVNDIRQEYEHCYFSVVPIYSGSGTCIKTLEAPSVGRIAVCSPFGARGISRNLLGNGVEVCDNSDVMLSMASKMVEDEDFRKDEELKAPLSVNSLYNFEFFAKIVKEGFAHSVGLTNPVEKRNDYN